MPPKASDPEPGSVMAQAPIFSIVRIGSAQRSFCAVVPLLMMLAAVSPTETPIAVTMPGQNLQSSTIGISCIAAESPPSARGRRASGSGASPRARAAAALFSRSIWWWKRCRASSSMPKVRKSLRRMS
jgi:hypothetical protein